MLNPNDSRKRRKLFAACAGVSILAVAGSVAVSTPTIAANGEGSYALWEMSGKTGSLPASDAGFPAATMESTVSVTTASGNSAYLADWTPFGQQYGTSDAKGYLPISVVSAGSTFTINFATPTPQSGWSFALGDVDSEKVRITARDAGGNPVDVNGWFKSTFNYCLDSPRPPTCGGVPETDVPTWDGTTLVGNVTDTKGATGWFSPTVPLSSITLTGERLIGFPQYQLWLATDFPLTPSNFAPVTTEVTPEVVPESKPVVTVTGTTRAPNQVVTIYRAPAVGMPTVKIAKTVSTATKTFRVPKALVGTASTAVFCARVGNKVSAPAQVKIRKGRGDVRPIHPVRPTGPACPAKGSR